MNLLKGNLQSIVRHHVAKIQSEVRLLLAKRAFWKQKKKTFWRPKMAYSSLKLLLLPSLTICLDMKQFVLVPASVYNKSLIAQSVTKQEFPNYQPLQYANDHIDSLKEDINKKLFSITTSLLDKSLTCPRIKLLYSQASVLISVETGLLFSDFAQKLRRRNTDFPDIYFTLLDAACLSSTLILNQNDK